MKSGELFIPSELVSKIYTVYLVQAFIMNLPIYNIQIYTLIFLKQRHFRFSFRSENWCEEANSKMKFEKNKKKGNEKKRRKQRGGWLSKRRLLSSKLETEQVTVQTFRNILSFSNQNVPSYLEPK